MKKSVFSLAFIATLLLVSANSQAQSLKDLFNILFIRHQNGSSQKIAIKFDWFLTIGIRPSLYFAVPDSKNLCNR